MAYPQFFPFQRILVSATPGEVTNLLLELKRGNKEAEGRLIPLVYKELRRIAAILDWLADCFSIAQVLEVRPEFVRQRSTIHLCYLELRGQA